MKKAQINKKHKLTKKISKLESSKIILCNFRQGIYRKKPQNPFFIGDDIFFLSTKWIIRAFVHFLVQATVQKTKASFISQNIVCFFMQNFLIKMKAF